MPARYTRDGGVRVRSALEGPREVTEMIRVRPVRKAPQGHGDSERSWRKEAGVVACELVVRQK